MLKDLGILLIDVHSQHQNLFLKDSVFQCQVLDTEADNEDLLKLYQIELKKLREIESELNSFKTDTQKKKDDLSYYKFRLDELEKANVQMGAVGAFEISIRFDFFLISAVILSVTTILVRSLMTDMVRRHCEIVFVATHPI